MPITSTSQQYIYSVFHVLLQLFRIHVIFVLEFIAALLSNIVLVQISNLVNIV